ncbi:3-oxoacid CoA-transferase subunit B [Chloroflexota bacterium]
MKAPLSKEITAKRIAQEFPDGSFVNLGIGLPTLASNFVPEGRSVVFQSENGILGYGPLAREGEEDPELVNAGGEFITLLRGAAIVDQSEAFVMIRGGHIDIAVLGALQVSEEGDLANWFVPERGVGRIGGAMDVAVGARKLIVAMTHATKEGEPKIVKQCTYPLTAKKVVNLIVTDLAVIEVTEKGLLLKEVAPGFTAEEIQAVTEPKLILGEVKEIEV